MSRRDERGQALAEFVVVIPALLLILFGIIEFGSAWRSYQVVTNTAREGARIAVLPGSSEARVLEAVEERLAGGGLDPGLATVEILCGDEGSGSDCFGSARTGQGTEVRVAYPYTFLVLGPVARIGGGDGSGFGSVTMRTGIVMRNE